ncbi:hypothetical protein [Falsochrobactrum shanghaiense]|nr:hypothetical protein [Falsochrobactrum shanghaiense]
MNDQYRSHSLLRLCAAFLVLSMSYAAASAGEQKLALIQPLPEKPSEAPPYENVPHESFVPAEALGQLGIDPIITGPVPKARRSWSKL